MADNGPDDLCKRLFDAASTNKIDQMTALLQNRDLRIDQPDQRDGCTALHRACEHGFTEMAKLLIRHGAKLEVAGNSGTSPLYIAAAHGRVDIIRFLVKEFEGFNPADPKYIRNIDQRSPLNAAAHINLADAMHWLLRGVNREDMAAAMHPDCNGWSPVHIVCQRGYIDCLIKLRDSGADLNASIPLQKFVDCRILTPRDQDPHADSPTEIPCWSPLHVAAHYGQTVAMQKLLEARADLLASRDSAANALQTAALTGRSETVAFLLDKIKATVREDELSRVITPAVASSCCLGHADAFLKCLTAIGDLDSSQNRVNRILGTFGANLAEIRRLVSEAPNQGMVPRRENELNELSNRLYESLCNAGFNESRAAVQIALADELELLIQNRLSNPNNPSASNSLSHRKACVVGSYSEGWGGSFSCLDGNIEADSDIDVTSVRFDRLFHLQNYCTCSEEQRKLGVVATYEKGHITVPGFPGNPTLPYGPSSLRPAVDRVDAFQCCCYPPLKPLEAKHKSKFPEAVLVKLRDATNNTSHLVPAMQPREEQSRESTPDTEVCRLRLSTTILERLTLRSLTTVQGQVYVILKYLLKRVLEAKVKGLKSYHIKTILFYMLDEIPTDEWTESELVKLVKDGLQRLLDWLNKTDRNDSMPHFFLPDAIVYLKRNTVGNSHAWTEVERKKVKEALEDVRNNLDETLLSFMEGLKPCRDSLMRFHPLLLHPALGSIELYDDPARSQYEPYEVYDAVAKLLKMFSTGDSSIDDFLWRISLFPDCAKTTAQCLKVLVYLKFDLMDEAKASVRESLSWTVSKGCPIDYDFQANGPYLQSSDTLYKFGLRLDRRPALDFLPHPISKWFPCGISYYMHQYYLNFHALLRCLTLHVLGDEMDSELAASWFVEVVDSPESDAQELLTVLKFCNDEALLVRLIQEHRRVICDLYETLDAVLEILSRNPNLPILACGQTIQAVRQGFEPSNG